MEVHVQESKEQDPSAQLTQAHDVGSWQTQAVKL